MTWTAQYVSRGLRRITNTTTGYSLTLGPDDIRQLKQHATEKSLHRFHLLLEQISGSAHVEPALGWRALREAFEADGRTDVDQLHEILGALIALTEAGRAWRDEQNGARRQACIERNRQRNTRRERKR